MIKKLQLPRLPHLMVAVKHPRSDGEQRSTCVHTDDEMQGEGYTPTDRTEHSPLTNCDSMATHDDGRPGVAEVSLKVHSLSTGARGSMFFAQVGARSKATWCENKWLELQFGYWLQQ